MAARACLAGIDGLKLLTTTDLEERTLLLALTELACKASEQRDRQLALFIAEYVLTGLFGAPEGGE